MFFIKPERLYVDDNLGMGMREAWEYEEGKLVKRYLWQKKVEWVQKTKEFASGSLESDVENVGRFSVK